MLAQIRTFGQSLFLQSTAAAASQMEESEEETFFDAVSEIRHHKEVTKREMEAYKSKMEKTLEENSSKTTYLEKKVQKLTIALDYKRESLDHALSRIKLLEKMMEELKRQLKEWERKEEETFRKERRERERKERIKREIKERIEIEEGVQQFKRGQKRKRTFHNGPFSDREQSAR